MELKWVVGFGWIAIVLVASIILIQRGKNGVALLLSGLTLPGATLVLLIGNAIFETYASQKPDSAAFKSACNSVGATYFRKPKWPVSSIAYDWEIDTYPPQFSFFKIDENKNVSAQSRGVPALPKQIQFSEARCCRDEGPPLNGVRPFIHRPFIGPYYGITELSADVLVTFKQVEQPSASLKLGLEGWLISVQDRRDGQILAELRYATDRLNNRACGETSLGVMDELSFVLQAVDIPLNPTNKR